MIWAEEIANGLVLEYSDKVAQKRTREYEKRTQNEPGFNHQKPEKTQNEPENEPKMEMGIDRNSLIWGRNWAELEHWLEGGAG